jgi:hypothetical protein
MINFMIPDYLATLRLIQQETNLHLQGIGPLTDDAKSRITQNLQFILQKADKLGLPTVRNRVERILGKLRVESGILTNVDTTREMRIVLESFEDDTKFLYLYAYPRDKVTQFIKMNDVWHVALWAFPSIESDLSAATDLYALGHNLSCVFHLMRVMEIGVRRFGRSLRVPLTRLTGLHPVPKTPS